MPRRVGTVAVFAVLFLITAQAQHKTTPAPNQGAKTTATQNEDPQLFRNATVGFRFQIPYGWVDRTKDLQAGHEAGKADVLLAVFEHPPEAMGNTVNSAVVIASESASSYPGIKRAEDYLGPLTELATAKGFKTDGDPYEVDVESRQLMRADFVKTLNDQLTMHQCTLVLLAKTRIVSFTFIARSEDELDELMDGLHFAVAKPSTR
jgi:hypothetical protein